jgi:hypothetical protein
MRWLKTRSAKAPVEFVTADFVHHPLDDAMERVLVPSGLSIILKRRRRKDQGYCRPLPVVAEVNEISVHG